MTQKPVAERWSRPESSAKDEKAARKAAALRANLGRRKAQSRARAADDLPEPEPEQQG